MSEEEEKYYYLKSYLKNLKEKEECTDLTLDYTKIPLVKNLIKMLSDLSEKDAMELFRNPIECSFQYYYEEFIDFLLEHNEQEYVIELLEELRKEYLGKVEKRYSYITDIQMESSHYPEESVLAFVENKILDFKPETKLGMLLYRITYPSSFDLQGRPFNIYNPRRGDVSEIGEMGKDALPAVSELLNREKNDYNAYVQMAAEEALKNIGSDCTFEELNTIVVEDKNEDVQLWAFKSILRKDPPPINYVIDQMKKNSNPKFRRLAIEFLTKNPDDKLLDLLREQVVLETDLWVNKLLCDFVKNRYLKFDMSPLYSLLETSKVAEEKITYIRVIGFIGTKKDIPQLDELIKKEQNEIIKYELGWAIRGIQKEELFPYHLELIFREDIDYKTRARSVLHLQKFTGDIPEERYPVIKDLTLKAYDQLCHFLSEFFHDSELYEEKLEGEEDFFFRLLDLYRQLEFEDGLLLFLKLVSENERVFGEYWHSYIFEFYEEEVAIELLKKVHNETADQKIQRIVKEILKDSYSVSLE